VVSHPVGNNFGDIASVCGLLSSLLFLPLVSFVIDCKPVDCIGSDAWRQAGLTVPPDEVVSQGWMAVIKYLQKVRICIFITESWTSLRACMPALTNSPVMHYSSWNHVLPQIKRLLSAAPGSTLDCGALYDPPMLLSALEHASSSPEGSAFCFARFCNAPVGLLPLSEMPCSLRVARDMPYAWYSCRGQDNRRVVESTFLRRYSSSFTAASQVQDAGWN
jgi:hypothetical protein